MEGIYLMHIREFIKSNENIFKLCNSIDMQKQIQNHAKPIHKQYTTIQQ